MRVIATAGDPETGIANMTIQSELSWRCKLGPQSETIGIVERAPIAFEAFPQPSSPIAPMQINVLSKPVEQTSCPRTAGKGPAFIGGFVRVTATNGASPALATTSKTFAFDYEDAIGPPTGTRLSSGHN